MKIALIQHSFKSSRKETLSHTLDAIREASKKGAELVVLQELHTSEYFCQSEEVDFFEYADHFEEDVRIFSESARENGVVLVSSLFEKRAVGLYHNTAVVFEKDGSIAGKYRKMHIPDDPGFYEKFYFTPGDLGFQPIDTSVGRLGVLVCWDQWYPEAARLMALAGADVLIYPTAIGWFDADEESEKIRQKEAWVTIQRSHAVANGVPVISVNRVGFEPDASGTMEGIRFWGGSFVSGPQGEILIQGDEISDSVLMVEIDKKRVDEVRRIWPFLRDRRIDAYDDLTRRYRD